MKRFVLFIIAVTFSIFINAASITWIGASGSNWNTASNWSTNTVPTSIDDVIFNTSVLVNMDVLSSTAYIINSLKITSNSSVILRLTQAGGGNRILQVKSTNAATMGLEIDAGCTLLMHGINTNASGTLNYILDLGGAMGVTGEIFGELHFSGVGSGGTDDETRLRVYTDVSNNASLVVKSGGVIKYLNLTGNTTSSAGVYLTMENGSTYYIEKNGGSFPEATWQANSLAKVFNATGSNPPSFLGTTYGNLEWNCPFQNNYSLLTDMTFNNVNLIHTNGAVPTPLGKVFRIVNSGSSVRTLTINGNLTISNNSIFEITGSSTMTSGGGRLHLKGNLINSGTILTSGAFDTVNEFELNGTLNQNIQITGTGFLSAAGTTLGFIMNNAEGATLLSPLTLPASQLLLLNGKIKTDAVNILTLSASANWLGGSSSSFVEGPMRRTGTGIYYTMPIGKGSIYAKLEYYSTLNYAVTDTFTAEYFRSNPQSIYGNNLDLTPSFPPGFQVSNHISYVEYWSLVNNTATQPSRVILTVTQYSFCTDGGMDSTFVVRYNAGDNQWKNWGNGFTLLGVPVPPYIVGSIDSDSSQRALGIFTLGTSLTKSDNPLPIKLVSFDATKFTNTKSSINWELAACCSAAAKFEIQRAGTDKSFVTIGTIGGSETSKLYNYIDNGLKNGVNYYRLKMTDEDGKITYSRTVAVMNGVNGLLFTSLIPTMVTNSATLTVASSCQRKLDLVITDMQGRVMLRRNYTIAAGNTSIELQLTGLAAGTYQLMGISAEGKTTFRFIKQ